MYFVTVMNREDQFEIVREARIAFEAPGPLAKNQHSLQGVDIAVNSTSEGTL